MSTLPGLFRRSQSVCLKQPQKQGGIFSLNLQKANAIDYTSLRATTSFSRRSASRTGCQTATTGTGRTTYRNSFFQDKNMNEHLEADSLRSFYDNVLVKKQEIVSEMNSTKQEIDSIKQCFIRAKCKHQQQMQNIKDKSNYYFKELRTILSQLRRDTGMQSKVNNQDAIYLKEQFESLRQISQQFQSKAIKMKNFTMGNHQ